jgi:excisionase family DNA binding protein
VGALEQMITEMLPAIKEAVRQVVREELCPAVMTVDQAAAYTGRAPKTIRGWLLAGLPSEKKGRRVHVRRADLDAWRSRPEPTVGALVASLRRVG